MNPSLQGLSNGNVSLKMQMPQNFDRQYRLTDVVQLAKIIQRIPDGHMFVQVIGHHMIPWFDTMTRNEGKGSR
jgi:hypothetical protein